MAVNLTDLESFHRFAKQRLAGVGAESVAKLAREWEARRESDEAIADILEGEADIEAGRVHPVEEVFADVRRKLGMGE